MAKRNQLTPIEREIRRLTRRVDNARKRIADIRLKATNESAEIEARLEADLVVLRALREHQEKQ